VIETKAVKGSAAKTRTLIVLVALAIAGCGAVMKVAYNNGGLAVRMMANDYLGLQGEQTALSRAQIDRFHQWHRRTEMPEYATLLDGAAARVAKGLKREDIVWAIRNLRARYKVLAEHAVEDAMPVVATLGPDNYVALEKKFAENNAKYARENLSSDPRKRERAHMKKIVGRFEEWTGDLSEEQKALVAAYVRASPRYTSVQFEDRKMRQGQLLQKLKTQRGNPALRDELRRFFAEIETRHGPEYDRLAREQEERAIQLMLDMDRTLTPDQRDRAVKRLQKYAEDCRIVARGGQAAQAMAPDASTS
jgi:hypothetical protein